MALLYIWYTHKNLRLTSSSHTLTSHSTNQATLTTTSSSTAADTYARRFTQLLHHLIATNIMIIALDAVLLGIVYAEMWYLQGNMKPAVYGVKLRIEFSILNRLVTLTKAGRRERVGSAEEEGEVRSVPSFVTKEGGVGRERTD